MWRAIATRLLGTHCAWILLGTHGFYGVMLLGSQGLLLYVAAACALRRSVGCMHGCTMWLGIRCCCGIMLLGILRAVLCDWARMVRCWAGVVCGYVAGQACSEVKWCTIKMSGQM